MARKLIDSELSVNLSHMGALDQAEFYPQNLLELFYQFSF